jgi:orotate phosphoribosyltransferase
MPALFKFGRFLSHSGLTLDYKLCCDAFTEADWTALAFLVNQRLGPFGLVVGIPRGGLPFAAALWPLRTKGVDRTLLVDDIFTTGASMDEYRNILGSHADSLVGVTVFTRSPKVPPWVHPILAVCADFQP